MTVLFDLGDKIENSGHIGLYLDCKFWNEVMFPRDYFC